MKTNFYIEYHGRKELYNKIVDSIKEIWKGKGGTKKENRNTV